MDYKIQDFSSDLKRRFRCIKDNHLFMFFFIVFVIVFGSCGIWIDPLLLAEEKSLSNFAKSLNTVAFVSYSAPLVSVTLFDSVVRLATKHSRDPHSIDVALVVWFAALSITLIAVIIVLFALGADHPGTYSPYSATAWILVLTYWALVNIDNPLYQNPGSPSSASGTDKYEDLLQGGN